MVAARAKLLWPDGSTGAVLMNAGADAQIVRTLDNPRVRTARGGAG